jgi:hypothetical protein
MIALLRRVHGSRTDERDIYFLLLKVTSLVTRGRQRGWKAFEMEKHEKGDGAERWDEKNQNEITMNDTHD